MTDSEIVLHRLSSEKLSDSSVARRIKEIKKLTNQHQWRYCSSASNPADLLSRGVPASTLLDQNNICWKGPPWFIESEENWPNWRKSGEHDILTDTVQGSCILEEERRPKGATQDELQHISS